MSLRAVVRKLTGDKPGAEECFDRFVELNKNRYRVVSRRHFSLSDLRSEDSAGIVAACREWLPQLSDEGRRKACESIIRFHQAIESLRKAGRSLQSFLDEVEAAESLIQPCYYCGNEATISAPSLSSEPTVICDSLLCHAVHGEILAVEHREFKAAGLIP